MYSLLSLSMSSKGSRRSFNSEGMIGIRKGFTTNIIIIITMDRDCHVFDVPRPYNFPWTSAATELINPSKCLKESSFTALLFRCRSFFFRRISAMNSIPIRNPARIAAIMKVSANKCSIKIGTYIMWNSISPFYKIGFGDNTLRLIKRCKRQRAFGDLYPYHLLATGKIDLVLEGAIKLVDVAPFDCIIREAGGISTDIKGNSLNMKISSFAASNGHLHGKMLKILNS